MTEVPQVLWNLLEMWTPELSIFITRSTQEYFNLTDYYIGPETRSDDMPGGQHGEFMGRCQRNCQKK
jgi:hypothetical protein